jgi:membrane protease YdiL (CAAX protease family)
MYPPTATIEYHRVLVSDERRIGRGILAIALLIGGMALSSLTLTAAAALIDTAIGTETKAGFTPLVNAAGALSVGLLIPWSMLIQRRLYGVPAPSLSSVASHFRFDIFGRALLLVVPATVTIQIIQYWAPFPQTTWGWHDVLFLLATALVLVPFQAAGEEYGFRGLIFRVVGGWTRSARLGLVLGLAVSSLLFAAVHVSTSGWLNLWYVIFGVGTAYITWRTGGLEIAVVLHVVYNVSSFALDAALRVDPTAVTERGAAAVTVSALLPAILIVAAVAVVAASTRRTGTVRTPVDLERGRQSIGAFQH